MSTSLHSTKQIAIKKVFSKTGTVSCPSRPGNDMLYEFENVGECPLTFGFHPTEGTDFFSDEAILASTISHGMTAEEKAIAIWKMVAAHTFHDHLDYHRSLSPDYNPVKALVGLPYIMCGESAYVLAILAFRAGLPSRVVQLDGHIVAELFYDETWHMFDANMKVIFYDYQRQIADVQFLSANPDVINSDNMLRLNGYAVLDYFFIKDYKTFVKNSPAGQTDRHYHYITTANETENMGITLFPDDKITFSLTKNWPGSANNRYEASGTIIRKTNTLNWNFERITDTSFVYRQTSPFIINQVKVVSSQPMECNAWLVMTNPITMQEERTWLGNLINGVPLMKNFNEPSDSSVYFGYQILLQGVEITKLTQITIESGFRLNYLTFPLLNENPTVISLSNNRPCSRPQLQFTHWL